MMRRFLASLRSRRQLRKERSAIARLRDMEAIERAVYLRYPSLAETRALLAEGNKVAAQIQMMLKSGHVNNSHTGV